MKRSKLALALMLLLLVVALGVATPAFAAGGPYSLVPTNGALVAANAQTFSWLDSLPYGGSVDHWYLEISTSPSVDYYPWGYFSGNLAYASGRLVLSSLNLNAAGRALAPGTYYWHVLGYYGQFGSLGTAWSGVQSFTVYSATATAPRIGVNPTSLYFAVNQGDLGWHSSTIAISNTGGGTLVFKAQGALVGWLGLATGTTTGYVYTLPVGVRGSDDGTTPKAPGTYTSEVTVSDFGSSPAATNSPWIVPVTMRIFPSDGAAPTGSSVKIRNGAVATKATRVALNLAATDAGSGMGEMRFNNEGGAWSEWAPYATTKTWYLVAGDGTRTVQAQFRDKVGNATGTVSDTIVLDTVKPTTQAPSAASVVWGRTATLKYKVTDAVPNGGTATVTIKIKTLGGTTVKTLSLGKKTVNTATALSAKFVCKLAKKTYKYWVYATDAAGNTQASIGKNRLVVR